MARMCGILKVALREDDPGAYIRVAKEDVEGVLVQGKPIEPGLYFASREAIEQFGPRVIERLKRTPAVGHDGKPVFTDDTYTERAMTLPASARLETVDPRILM